MPYSKTTLNIDDAVVIELKRAAARQGRTMSELVEAALRQSLRKRSSSKNFGPLPTFDGGRELVDISDRDALYRVMEGR